MSEARQLSESEEQRAISLHEQSIVILMHDHLPIAGDIPKMQVGGVTAKVYNLICDVEISGDFRASANQYEGWAKRALVQIDQAITEIEANDKVLLALTAEDIEKAKREGKIAILLGSEGGKLLEGELSLLRNFYRLGLRELQLTWAFENQLANSKGLTDFGKDVVKEMNKLGIIIDLTHIPQRAFDDVLALTKHPVIISHCAAKAVSADLSDEQIRAIAQNGGVLGLHFYSTYMAKRLANGIVAEEIGVSDLVDHIDYIANLVGIDHVGLGADFFPDHGEWAEFQKAQGTYNIKWVIEDKSAMPDVTRELVFRGYSDSEIQKILGLNFLGICQKVMSDE
jgi:membrane dipeptidase